jgi:hypothetical protein
VVAALAVAVCFGALDWPTAAPSSVGAQPIVEGIRWPEISPPVAVGLGELPPEWQAEVRAALKVWNDGGSRFWFVDTLDFPGPNGVLLRPVDRVPTCGGQFQPAACTYPFVYQFAPWFFSHAVIQLDRDRVGRDQPRRPLDVVDRPALFTHELGHALGLGEASSPTAAMFPAALWNALGADDLRELRAMYGTVEGPRPERGPEGLTPSEGVAAPARPVLRWEPVPRATSYYLQLADASVYAQYDGGFVDVSFGEYVVDTTTESTEFALPIALAAGGEYYWRVKASTPGGNTPWSAAARLVVAAP